FGYPFQRPANGGFRNERLVALHVEHDIRMRISRPGKHFGHALRTRMVPRIGQDSVYTDILDDPGHTDIIRRHHQIAVQIPPFHSLSYKTDERGAGDETKGFFREA